MTAVYYNEHDPFAAQWLRNLITAGHLPAGDVDERDIQEVSPDDVSGYQQCHFFAGIGGWAVALQLADWPADRSVWTGSCPCQPFSAAGFQGGFDDPRHLWPVWFSLIQKCRPAVIFGEQVEAALDHGWLDLVQTNLESEAYAVAPLGLPAACVGTPGIRQRLWFVADAESDGFGAVPMEAESRRREQQPRQENQLVSGGLANADRLLTEYQQLQRSRRLVQPPTDALAGHWRDADWLLCNDGKARPVEPSTFPLAHGVPTRMGRLRGYGNAIVPQVAAEFIAAYLDVRH